MSVRRATRSQASTGNTQATIPKKKDQESDNLVPASGDLIELDSPTTTTTAAEEPISSPKMMDRKLSEVSWAVADVTSTAIDHKIAQHPPKLSVPPTTPPDGVKDLKRNRTEGANED